MLILLNTNLTSSTLEIDAICNILWESCRDCFSRPLTEYQTQILLAFIMLYLLGTLGFAEEYQIWLQKETLLSSSFPTEISLGFLEQSTQDELLFAIEESDLFRLDEKAIPYRKQRPTRSFPSDYLLSPDYQNFLSTVVDNYPDIALLHQIGRSVEGREIWAIRLSNTEDPLNSWKILAGHHGDELASMEIALQFLWSFTEYSTETSIQEWLQENELWIVPAVNPDGIATVSRYNAHNVDLNRNYSFEWSADEFRPGSNAFSEPESQSIRILEEWQSFSGGLSLHSGAKNIAWVWNYSVNQAPEIPY